MKLAEALILRADQRTRLDQLKQRLVRSARVQEGDDPPESPSDLLRESERTADELERLIQRINRTNSTTRLGDGTLSDALATRDVLALRRSVHAELAQAAAVVQDRYTKSEVKFKSTVNVADLQKRADALAKAYRELDARIQEANWKTDLLE
jgi:hypothetical protein